MRYLLHLLAAFITQKPRRMLTSGVDFQWSANLWTHNVFRVWELLVGYPCTKVGDIYTDDIYPSVYSWNDEEGSHQIAFTFEAQIALFEVWLRSNFKKFAFKIVVVPQLQLSGMSMGGLTPYRFAIAFDVESDNQGTSTATLAHTSTGSNLMLVGADLEDIVASDPLTAMSYNAVAMGKSTAIRFPSDRWTAVWTLPGTGTSGSVSTGLNNMVATGPSFNSLGATSFTGCKQTGQPDSTNTSSTSGTTMSFTTTVVAPNSWIVGFFYSGGSAFTNGTATMRGNATSFFSSGNLVDSNAIVGTGLQSITVTQGTGSFVTNTLSIAPNTGGGSTPQFVVPPPFIGN